MDKKVDIFRFVLNVGLMLLFAVHYWNDNLTGMVFVGFLLIVNILLSISEQIQRISKKPRVDISGNITFNEADKSFNIDKVDEIRR